MTATVDALSDKSRFPVCLPVVRVVVPVRLA